MTELRPLAHHTAHVIFRKNGYILETPEIVRWLDCADRWVLEQSEPGVIVIGPPRIGKTQARVATGAFLEDKLGASGVVYHLDIEGISNPKRGEFYELLLEAVGHAIVRKGSAADKKFRLLEYLKVEAARIRQLSDGRVPTFVFCGDETQNLWDENYQTLIFLYNRLEAEGVRAVFLLFGQPQLRAKRRLLVETHQQQIVARFMAREYEFHGVLSPKDMKEVMGEYDKAEYPEASGWSMTRYFFDEAVRDGHKFEEFGEALFSEFLAAKDRAMRGKEKKVGKDTGVPMEYLTRVVRHLCQVHGYQGTQSCYWPSHLHLRKAVQGSGYAEAELGLYTGNYEPDPPNRSTRK